MALLSAPVQAGPGGPVDKAAQLHPALDKFVLLTDGKSHYVAIVPFDSGEDTFFYGNGKRFFSVPVRGGGSSGNERFNRVFADPRYYIQFTQQSDLTFDKGKYTVTCGKTTTPLQVVDTKTAGPLLAAATFEPSPRKRQAYALARNSNGVYYYVDQGRSPETSKNFRLFIGPKGALKLQQMTNIVSDSEGDVFSTKTGSMRLVIGKKEPTWIAGKQSTTLLPVPIEDNLAMIYTELGVYAGEPMGTPCDDL